MRAGVLFVSPYREDSAVISRMLEALAVPVRHVLDFHGACRVLRENHYPVILTEAKLHDGTWLDVLELAHKLSPQTRVIVTDCCADTRFWAEVLNRGAYDLIAQPFATVEVQRILSGACSLPAARARVAHAAL